MPKSDQHRVKGAHPMKHLVAQDTIRFAVSEIDGMAADQVDVGWSGEGASGSTFSRTTRPWRSS